MGLGGFVACRALSQRNDDPPRASRPFDKDRDGFVLGEGAGILVLEEYEHAEGAARTIYAEVLGCGNTADAYHITAPHPDGAGARRGDADARPRRRLEPRRRRLHQRPRHQHRAGRRGRDDGHEDRSSAPHANKLAISSTKSMIGHLLGASPAASRRSPAP